MDLGNPKFECEIVEDLCDMRIEQIDHIDQKKHQNISSTFNMEKLNYQTFKNY